MEGPSVDISIWGGLLIGSSLIVLAQDSRFGVRAALLNVIERGDKSRFRAYLTAMGVTITAAQTPFASGQIDLSETIYRRKSIHLVGLIIGVFGAGMVLVGDCPHRLMVCDA